MKCADHTEYRADCGQCNRARQDVLPEPLANLTAEQAVAVAISIIVPRASVGDCMKMTPGFIRHLENNGYKVTRKE